MSRERLPDSRLSMHEVDAGATYLVVCTSQRDCFACTRVALIFAQFGFFAVGRYRDR